MTSIACFKVSREVLLFGHCSLMVCSFCQSFRNKSRFTFVVSVVPVKDPLINDFSSFIDILSVNTTLTELKCTCLFILFSVHSHLFFSRVQ